MKAHEFFGALMRAIGVWQVISGLVLLPRMANFFGQGLTRQIVGRAIWAVAAESVVHVVAGVVLFLAADWLVRLAYGRRESLGGDDGLPPVAGLPPAVITPMLLIVALGVSALHLWFASGPRPSAIVVPSTLHLAVLVAMGSGAMAFLFRWRWRPVNAFLAWWSILVGMELFLISFLHYY